MKRKKKRPKKAYAQCRGDKNLDVQLEKKMQNKEIKIHGIGKLNM